MCRYLFVCRISILCLHVTLLHRSFYHYLGITAIFGISCVHWFIFLVLSLVCSLLFWEMVWAFSVSFSKTSSCSYLVVLDVFRECCLIVELTAIAVQYSWYKADSIDCTDFAHIIYSSKILTQLIFSFWLIFTLWLVCVFTRWIIDTLFLHRGCWMYIVLGWIFLLHSSRCFLTDNIVLPWTYDKSCDAFESFGYGTSALY